MLRVEKVTDGAIGSGTQFRATTRSRAGRPAALVVGRRAPGALRQLSPFIGFLGKRLEAANSIWSVADVWVGLRLE